MLEIQRSHADELETRCTTHDAQPRTMRAQRATSIDSSNETRLRLLYSGQAEDPQCSHRVQSGQPQARPNATCRGGGGTNPISSRASPGGGHVRQYSTRGLSQHAVIDAHALDLPAERSLACCFEVIFVDVQIIRVCCLAPNGNIIVR